MTSDEQWAGTFDFECTGMDDHDYEDCRKCAGMRQRLTALLASRALEEANAWREAIFTGTSADLMAWIKQRIAALEQAAAGGGQ